LPKVDVDEVKDCGKEIQNKDEVKMCFTFAVSPA